MDTTNQPDSIDQEFAPVDEVGSHVSALAQTLYEVFYRAMMERFGSHYPKKALSASKHVKAFNKLATICLQNNWEPEAYVKHTLDYLHKSHHYITPADLLRTEMLDSYRTDLSKGDQSYTPEYDWKYYNMELITCICNANSTELRVLQSLVSPFPAWFRLIYLYPVDPVIMKYWGDDGRVEFASDRRLRELARKVAPQAFAYLETQWGKFADLEQKV